MAGERGGFGEEGGFLGEVEAGIEWEWGDWEWGVGGGGGRGRSLMERRGDVLLDSIGQGKGIGNWIVGVGGEGIRGTEESEARLAGGNVRGGRAKANSAK